MAGSASNGKKAVSGREVLGRLIAVVAMSSACATASAGETLVFAGYGGAYQKGMMSALVQPAADKLGVSISQNTTPGIAAVRMQVQSKRPAWDIVNLGTDECSAGSAQGLFEPLDYTVISADKLPSDAVGKDWVASNYYSAVLAYRTDKYGNNPPKTWKDFWDTSRFPGRRGMSDAPIESLEIALLADGVPADKLYPLDVDRAIRSLAKLKPHVAVWWSSGAQSAQLIANGEVDMEMIWSSRVVPVVADKAPVAYSLTNSILGMGCLAIPKGAKNAKLAQKMIGVMLTPELQASIPTHLEGYGPANPEAINVRKFSPQVLKTLNSSPENLAKAVRINASWWGEGENQKVATDKYKALISR